ncbi:MAG: FkbM family methyltransferase [Minwuia sp.]|nr:FkbM family methyltransferase [Minwuia sp.]
MSLKRLLARSVDILPWGMRNRIKSLPLVAPLQRWLVNSAMKDAEFVHRITAGPARGLTMRISLPDDKLYWTGTWEQDVTTALAAEVTQGMVCYDIGSHRGFMAGVMAASGAAEVICFEPNPENAATIEDLIALNPAMRLSLQTCAVGAEDTTATFEVMPETSMGKLSSSSFQHGTDGQTRIEVQVVRLDTLVDRQVIAPPDLLKIDIEGAEQDALLGAESTVARFRPVLLIEVHSHDLLISCRQWLAERNYRMRVVQQDLDTITAANFHVCHLVAKPA